jgi:hypothetical protein
MDVNYAWYGENFCVIEHQWRGTVPGTFFGIAGHGRPISFRILHAWEFKDGGISREYVWLHGNAIHEQLPTTELTGASAAAYSEPQRTRRTSDGARRQSEPTHSSDVGPPYVWARRSVDAGAPFASVGTACHPGRAALILTAGMAGWARAICSDRWNVRRRCRCVLAE